MASPQVVVPYLVTPHLPLHRLLSPHLIGGPLQCLLDLAILEFIKIVVRWRNILMTRG